MSLQGGASSHQEEGSHAMSHALLGVFVAQAKDSYAQEGVHSSGEYLDLTWQFLCPDGALSDQAGASAAQDDNSHSQRGFLHATRGFFHFLLRLCPHKQWLCPGGVFIGGSAVGYHCSM